MLEKDGHRVRKVFNDSPVCKSTLMKQNYNVQNDTYNHMSESEDGGED